MTTSHEAFRRGAQQLPELRLPAVGSGAMTPLRAPGRRAPLVVLLHGQGCAGCDAHLRELAEAAPSVAEWDGRLVAIRSDAPDSASPPPSDPIVLSDPDGNVATALSVEIPATIVADQWGEIQDIVAAGPEHAFMSTEELVEWARSLSVRCPECEGEAF